MEEFGLATKLKGLDPMLGNGYKNVFTHTVLYFRSLIIYELHVNESLQNAYTSICEILDYKKGKFTLGDLAPFSIMHFEKKSSSFCFQYRHLRALTIVNSVYCAGT